MAAKGKGKQLTFTLGGEAAEADFLLRDSFYETAQYRSLASKDHNDLFVIGRTGSGKSAMLQQIEEQNRGHVIRITPENLSLTYIAQRGSIRELAASDVRLAPFFIALWKHVFLVEIIRHRYSIHTPDAKQNFLATLRDRISLDRSKAAALDYLSDFGDNFWCETDERVREITERFERQVNAEAKVGAPSLGLGLSTGGTGTHTVEKRVELVQRFQNVVNATQMPRLNKMIDVLDQDILDSPQHFTWIIIDDLDKDWVDESLANELILCLFRAVMDLVRVQNLKIVVALRTNIFHALDFSKIAGQQEKFRSLSTRVSWTREELEGLLDQRVRSAGQRTGWTDFKTVEDILPGGTPKRGKALDTILSATLMRPRDAISYINASLEAASGRPPVTWADIHAALPEYSANRLLALGDEWQPTYPGIDRVFGVFAKAKTVLVPEAFREMLENVALLLVDADFRDSSWLREATEKYWEADPATPHDLRAFEPLVEILYRVGFIGLRLPGRKPVFAHEDPLIFDQHHTLEVIGSFIVHPAFWPVLGIQERPDLAGVP